jgi:SP family sugar:H+ symporter-like MFS transporter
LLQAFQQASGINFITGYGVVFFFAVGIDSVYLVQLGLYIVGIPAIWISQYCIEKFGRRPLLIVSGMLMITALFIMGGCGLVTNKSRSVDSTIVAMVYIFIFVFNIGWGPAVWVVTSEISTGGNRGKLMSISTASNWFFTWMVTFTFPYLDNADAANLGPKIGFLYGSLMIFACMWVYFYLPETAGRSLEEIHTLFQLGVPARQFKCE